MAIHGRKTLPLLAIAFQLFTLFPNSFSEDSETLATFTDASPKLQKQLEDLIKKITFNAAAKVNSGSTYERITIDKVQYRLDTDRSQNGYTKFHIQGGPGKGKATYTTVLLKIDVPFGAERIKKAFRDGLKGPNHTVTLTKLGD